MKTTKTILTVFVLIVFAVTNIDLAFCQDVQTLEKMVADEELEQEFKWLKAETYVITASRVRENIKKSAASITVITDRQIRQMGARHLADVFRAVPGFYALEGTILGQIFFSVRGAQPGTNSSKVLLMINSHPVNEPRTGGPSWVHDRLIVENIKRIEFIRGPGSSLYGTNAFLGVINVITKDAEDVDGLEITARGGSWDTQQYNLLYGKTFGDLEVAFNFNYFKTHGFRGLLEQDLQTYSDQIWGAFGFPPASLAPGHLKGNDEKYDAALNLKYKGITFDGRYVEREKDLPVGWGASLNQKSVDSSKDYYLNLSYEKSIWEGFDISGKVYRNHFELPQEAQVYPPGHVTPVFPIPALPPPAPPPPLPTIMPEGQNFDVIYKDDRTGIEIQATYKSSDSNTFVAGVNYEEVKDYGIRVLANYIETPSPIVIIPLPSLTRIPVEGNKRNIKAIFIEDIWEITDEIRLSAGIRYDRYSDFGDEFSPHFGLTWGYMKGYDVKFLYGHGFRAPAYFELYTPPGNNPDLSPETIDTYQLSFGAEFTPSLGGRLTLYHRVTEDNIITTSTPIYNWINQGKSRDQGIEVELKYDFGKGTYVSGYYTYRNFKTDDMIAPKHVGSVMANVRLSRYMNFYVDCPFASNTQVPSSSPRSNISSRAIVNATLIAKKFLKGYEGLELRSSVYNLLDKDYTSYNDTRGIPDGLPMPGINYLLEIKYEF